MMLAAGMWGLVSALLVLGVRGNMSLQELPEIQHKAVKLMMADFHNKDNVKYSFRFSSVIKATEEEYSAGKFVSMELLLKQTSCSKRHWERSNCPFAGTQITFNCAACFKFEYESHKVISQFINCIPEKKLIWAHKQSRDNKCKEVAQKITVTSRIPVGKYSFLKSQ